MADFNINIATKPIKSQYTFNSFYSTDFSTCDLIKIENPIGLIQNTNDLDIPYLLSSYSNVSNWKTLKIKNIQYSNSNGLYLAHNSLKIPEAGNVEYDIDITGVLPNTAISNFTLTYDNLVLTNTGSITFEAAIEDSNNITGTFFSFSFLIQPTTCVEINPIEDLNVVSSISTECNITAVVRVNVPPQESRYVFPFLSDVYSSSDSVAQTITETTDFTITITVTEEETGSILSKAAIYVYESSFSTQILKAYQITRRNNGNFC